MGLKTAVLSERKVQGGKCSFIQIYPALSKRDAAELREMLVDPTINHMMLTRGLAAAGYKVGSSTVARHRNGECSCGSL